MVTRAFSTEIDEWIGVWALPVGVPGDVDYRPALLELTDWDGRPLLVTPFPSEPGVWFDAAAVERVLRFFLLLTQLIGRWAGREFRLLDWQVRWLVAPVFGLKWPGGLRVIRTFWFEIPRKSGKSTLCSGLALYMLMADREAAAEVYAAAGDKAQAMIVFRAARNMAAGSEAIVARLGRRGIQRALLEHPVTGSIFRALASDQGGRLHGLNVHAAFVDEVHVHKTPDTIDAVETGTGSRSQPLIGFITTADDGEDGSVYATKREYVEGLAAGTVVDSSFYAVVFGADETVAGFDPFSLETLRAANPGFGVTVLGDYLTRKADEARQSPAQLNRYLRLHLNIRTKQTVRWLPMDRWDAAAGMDEPAAWADRTVFAGLDLSSTTDMTAFVLLCPDGDGYMVHPMFWLPEERAEQMEAKTGIPYGRWNREGFLHLTEGNVVDYGQMRGDITAEVARLGCRVAEVAYDPWNATETVQEMERAGYVMVPTRQGYATLSPACKELERLVMGSTPEAPLFRHGGHPVLRWNADCVEVRTDEGGNVKPVKPDRGKSSKRIDGVAAAVNALSRAMLRKPPKSRRVAGF